MLDPLAIFSQGLRVAENEFLNLCAPVKFDTLKVGQDALVHLVHGLFVLAHQALELDYL